MAFNPHAGHLVYKIALRAPGDAPGSPTGREGPEKKPNETPANFFLPFIMQNRVPCTPWNNQWQGKQGLLWLAKTQEAWETYLLWDQGLPVYYINRKLSSSGGKGNEEESLSRKRAVSSLGVPIYLNASYFRQGVCLHFPNKVKSQLSWELEEGRTWVGNSPIFESHIPYNLFEI